jgi:hypothetical protein
MDVHCFWVGRPLNRLEQWCLHRFQTCGFTPRLWGYEQTQQVPDGVRLENAAALIPAEQLFLNRRGSYASFADLFRYTLLARHGGLWSDLDVVCLHQAAALPDDAFLVTERHQEGGTRLNNNVIYAPTAAAQAHLQAMAEQAAAMPRDQVVWAQLGPQLLQAYVDDHPHHGFTIQPPDYANPVNWWEVPQAFQNDGYETLTEDSGFLHLYAERWRRAGCDSSVELDGGRQLERWLAA